MTPSNSARVVAGVALAGAAALAVLSAASPVRAQVDLPPLPPPPAETAPVTDTVAPVAEPGCGSIDGTMPSDVLAVIAPWLAVLCPPAEPPPAAPEEPDGGGDAPPHAGFDVFEDLYTIAPVVAPLLGELGLPAPPAVAQQPVPAAIGPGTPTFAAGSEGFAYGVVLLLPLALLVLGGFVGWATTRPVEIAQP